MSKLTKKDQIQLLAETKPFLRPILQGVFANFSTKYIHAIHVNNMTNGADFEFIHELSDAKNDNHLVLEIQPVNHELYQITATKLTHDNTCFASKETTTNDIAMGIKDTVLNLH